MTATVRPGIYLDQHKPARSQFRLGRRATPKPVVVVHTAESGTAPAGNVAEFIRNRATPGSYHLLGDPTDIIQLVNFDHEAYHDGTGSNRWSTGISLAMNASEWTRWADPARLHALVDTAAQMAAIVARWHASEGRSMPAARLISKAQSETADASGFISHAQRDPSRRSDPGPDFPWEQFFDRYRALIQGATVPNVPDRSDNVRQVQAAIAAAHYAHAWWTDSRDLIDPTDTTSIDRYVDGDLGPSTLLDLLDIIDSVNELDADRATVRKAAQWDALTAALAPAIGQGRGA